MEKSKDDYRNIDFALIKYLEKLLTEYYEYNSYNSGWVCEDWQKYVKKLTKKLRYAEKHWHDCGEAQIKAIKKAHKALNKINKKLCLFRI